MNITCLPLALLLLVVSALAGFAQEAQKKATRAEGEVSAITRVQPEYPPIAKQLKLQGTVELEALVNGSGAVDKVNILSGNPVLTRPAADALKKWKFKPFLEEGKAVSTLVPVTIAFKL